MKQRRLFPAIALTLAFLASSLTADTLPTLFQKAKEQFRLRSYAAALSTLDRLAAESSKPGLEAQRSALLPGLSFYRGASLAALGREAEAETEFAVYLTFQPNAVLDPALYPRSVIAALEKARTEVQQGRGERSEEVASASIATSYRDFARPAAGAEPPLGEEWAEGPAGVLLTLQEKRDFSRLSDPVSRSEFVTNFWKARDPKPETADNEFREEFEKRVAYADAYFAQDEKRGSLTDRGTVFLLLGPPTWIGRKPLRTGDDRTENSGLGLYNRHDFTQAKIAAGNNSGAQAAAMDRLNSPTATMANTGANWLEVWHYRKELLPQGTPYQQVDFDFLTKQGYGKNVLQREQPVLLTLELARSADPKRTSS